MKQKGCESTVEWKKLNFNFKTLHEQKKNEHFCIICEKLFEFKTELNHCVETVSSSEEKKNIFELSVEKCQKWNQLLT